jgi:ERCC4-type nuclease
MSSGCQVIFIVEGDLKSVHFPYESLLGAAVNAELRRNCHVFRTTDIWETALLLRHLVLKMEHCSTSAPNGLRLTPKRKRDADSETCWMRMLMCIPSVSEMVAKALLKQFGTLANLQSALVDISTFPRIQLNERSCIGAKRLKTLRAYLVSA